MMVRLLPGDPARIVAGLLASESDVEHIRHQLGLDQPGPVQYAAFLGRLVHFDLGTSVRSGQPVMSEVLARLPWTAELAATSIAVAAALGIGGGMPAALQHNRRPALGLSALTLVVPSLAAHRLPLLAIVRFSVELHLL